MAQVRSGKSKGRRRTKTSKSSSIGGRQLALSVHSGLMEGAFFPLSRKHNVIGRKINAHIPIKDSKVSREHATITNAGGDYMIRDLGSTNGTFVNNERVEDPVRLSVGDKIRIGAYTFKVEPVVQKQETEVQKWSSETKVLFRDPSMLKMAHASEVASKATVSKKEKSLAGLFDAFIKYAPAKFTKNIDHEKLKWVLLLALVIGVSAGIIARDFFFASHAPTPGESYIVDVAPGTGFPTLFKELNISGPSEKIAKIWLKLRRLENSLKVGEFQLDPSWSAAKALEHILTSPPIYHTVTIKEGENIYDIYISLKDIFKDLSF